MKNKISVLITNYNKSKFLFKTLRSVCNQNFKNYEIILYDDASSDNSIEIIKKFKKVKLITNKKKKNISAPLNQINGVIQCFKKSKGNILLLLDGDDVFKKYKLKKIDQFFKDNKKINCVFDIPLNNINQFKLKKRPKKYSVWPTIFPTSCISLRRNFLKIFLKNIYMMDFPHLEIDARLSIFAKFYMNEYNIFNKRLTHYNYDQQGITAAIKKYSNLWWLRRSEAFTYLRILMKKKKIPFTYSFDYFITNFLVFFYK
tara:strand:+ start:228 stop:1001 length:774 start_codon:yes stop_codon:yes gene_type:complete